MHRLEWMRRKPKFPTHKLRLQVRRLTRKEHFWKEGGRKLWLLWVPQPNKNWSRSSTTRNTTRQPSRAGRQSWRRLVPCSIVGAQISQKRALKCRCARQNNNVPELNLQADPQSWMRRTNSVVFWMRRTSNFRQTSTRKRRRLKSHRQILITRESSHLVMGLLVNERCGLDNWSHPALKSFPLSTT